jgi:predicted ATP-dependent endonuclease of OLD family
MLLKVKGIGKIQDSAIEMQGVTVIAGENNTGKSTFGKVLYCMFNAFCNLDATVFNEKIRTLGGTIIRYFASEGIQSIHLSDKLIENILDLKDVFSAEKLRDILVGSDYKIIESDVEKIDDTIQDLATEIERYINLNDIEIKKIIINRYFRKEFFGQINHINRPEVPGEVSLIIKGQEVRVILTGNECTDLNDELGIIHNAIYIDTPFVLDEVGSNRIDYLYNFSPNEIYHRTNLFLRLISDNETAVITEAITKQKLDNVQKIISTMANGDFIKKENSLTFADRSMKQPIALQNISTGTKIFLIVKRLLEQNQIKEKDVLIFDEPEIHLHPEWQIKFAEILILLQKEFNLTILLTTHSPYFLHAIEVYSDKYSIKDKLNCYLAESDGDISVVRDVTENIDSIYKQLALPFQKLEDVQYED